MTLTSYFLVTFESENAGERAGLKYFIITHGATLCMVAAVLVPLGGRLARLLLMRSDRPCLRC